MSELDDLYQTLILDHNRSPRNFRELPAGAAHAEGHNPLCGDTFNVWVNVENGVVADVSFLGQGCAISKASASMMTTVIKGKTVAEARTLFERFHEMVTGRSGNAREARATLGCLSAFSGVSTFPIRIKCATLAWHALMKAVDEGIARSTAPAPEAGS